MHLCFLIHFLQLCSWESNSWESNSHLITFALRKQNQYEKQKIMPDIEFGCNASYFLDIWMKLRKSRPWIPREIFHISLLHTRHIGQTASSKFLTKLPRPKEFFSKKITSSSSFYDISLRFYDITTAAYSHGISCVSNIFSKIVSWLWQKSESTQDMQDGVLAMIYANLEETWRFW